MLHLTPLSYLYLVIPRHDHEGTVTDYLILGNGGHGTIYVSSLQGATESEKIDHLHKMASELPCVRVTSGVPFYPATFFEGLMQVDKLTRPWSSPSSDNYPTQAHVESVVAAKIDNLYTQLLQAVDLRAIDAVSRVLPTPERLAALTIKAIENTDNRYGRRIRARKSTEKEASKTLK